jgi:hypothetical protein
LQTAEWNNFFDSIPTEADEIPIEQRFTCNLGYLLARKTVAEDAVPFSDPGEYVHPDEIIVWKHYGKARLEEDRLIRRIKFSEKKRKQERELHDLSETSDDDADSDNDDGIESSLISKQQQLKKKLMKSQQKAQQVVQHVPQHQRVTRSQTQNHNQVSTYDSMVL